MLDKIIKVIDVEKEGKSVPYLEYRKETEVLQENGIPQPEGTIPTFSVRMSSKTYTNDLLEHKISDNLERDVFFELLDTAEEVEGILDDLPELISLADMKIYDSTKRFIANTIICNESMKEVVSNSLKTKNYNFSTKDLIICKYIPDNYILSIYASIDLISWAAILVKGKEKYLLDIINPSLIKRIHVFEKHSFKLPEDYSMYDMSYCIGNDCQTPCARKKGPSGICTVSDLTKVCSDYTRGE